MAFFLPRLPERFVSAIFNLICTGCVLPWATDEDGEDWETDFIPGTQHTNSTPHYDSYAQYNSQFEVDAEAVAVSGGHSVVGEHNGYGSRSHVQSPHMFGTDGNHLTFTPQELYGYRNFAPGLNLNARFYS